jgi:RHS repeat-associated protein
VSSATYDADNRLTNWNGVPLAYDANGNLSSYGSSSYSWNARDELIGTSDGGGSFSYDAFGRRTSQTVTGVTTPYLYDGENPATISGYMLLNGLSIDERFAETSPEGASSYVSDALGSTIGVTDADGALVGGYSYAPYGATSFAGSVTTPFEFTGREHDGASNLYYYRARYYSPELGRFISEDPSGFAGGLDLYAYASGNPVSNGDPLGLYPAIVVTLPNGSSYAPMTEVKNSAQALPSAYGLPVGTPVPIAVPAGVNPQAIVDETSSLGFGGMVLAFRPGGPLDFKLINPMYDALGNFLFGAAGAEHGSSCETMTWIGDEGHGGKNNPINTADIQSGFQALFSGGQLSVMDTTSPNFPWW